MPKTYRRVDPRKGDAILTAATALLLKDGFDNTSMDAIAHMAIRRSANAA